MTIVRAIHYSSDPAWWQRVAPILGLSPTRGPGEFAGGGLLTVRDAEAAGREDGSTELELLVPDPAAALARAAAVASATNAGTTQPGATQATVRATDGQAITVSSAVERTAAPATAHHEGPVAVLPIWYGPDRIEPNAILTALGLLPRLASDTGTWLDFTADGGGHLAWHHSPTAGLELAFEHAGDLDALAGHLTEVGVGATVVDEAYNRTLLLTGPHGRQVWVNGTQRDLYGYSPAAGPATT